MSLPVSRGVLGGSARHATSLPWYVRHRVLLDLVLPALCLAVCVAWASCLPVDQAPDEYMRTPIPLYILQHGELPLGSAPEIRNEIWGSSYGYTPYGTSLLSVVFGWVAGALGAGEAGVLFAFRLPSCLFVAAAVLVCEKVGRRLFASPVAPYAFGAFVGFLPQVVFLGSYLNQDSMTIFATALVLHAWLVGIDRRWDLGSALLLGVALGVLALSYYFAYGFVLLSIVVYVVSGARMVREGQARTRSLALHALVVFAVAMVVGGWFFVRNFLLYDGDLFGRSASSRLAEQYAMPGYRPSDHPTPQSNGVGVLEMVRGPYGGTRWWATTAKSFIGAFGYMTEYLSYKVYAGYALVLGVGVVLSPVYLLRGRRVRHKALVIGSLVACALIVVGLDVYYSWAVDYQPQGRYLMGALVLLMLLAAAGVDALACGLCRRGSRVADAEAAEGAAAGVETGVDRVGAADPGTALAGDATPGAACQPAAATRAGDLLALAFPALYLVFFAYVAARTIIPLCTGGIIS